MPSLFLVLALLFPGAVIAAGALPLAAALDRNPDGHLEADELPQEARKTLLWALDSDDDGILDAGELSRIGRSGASVPRRSGHKLDVYAPPGDGPFPIIVFFHGGGLYGGDKLSLEKLGERFARLGYLVVAPNYRLSPEFYFPAYVEDAARAVRWAWDHADDFGGDRQRLSIYGGSAGGHIAALLSVDWRYLRATGLGLASIKTSLPITAMMDARRAGKQPLLLTWEGNPEIAAEASPIEYVAADLPPMLITVADGNTSTAANRIWRCSRR